MTIEPQNIRDHLRPHVTEAFAQAISRLESLSRDSLFNVEEAQSARELVEASGLVLFMEPPRHRRHEMTGSREIVFSTSRPDVLESCIKAFLAPQAGEYTTFQDRTHVFLRQSIPGREHTELLLELVSSLHVALPKLRTESEQALLSKVQERKALIARLEDDSRQLADRLNSLGLEGDSEEISSFGDPAPAFHVVAHNRVEQAKEYSSEILSILRKIEDTRELPGEAHEVLSRILIPRAEDLCYVLGVTFATSDEASHRRTEARLGLDAIASSVTFSMSLLRKWKDELQSAVAVKELCDLLGEVIPFARELLDWLSP